MTQGIWRDIEGDPASGLLLVADHASNRVPGDIDLGIAQELLDKHIAVDIGIAALAPEVAARLRCPGIVAGISRLVVDLHREADNPAVIPTVSDGYAVHGNALLSHEERQERLARFWRPYHDHVAARIDAGRPNMLFTLHSFTPQLESHLDQPRPWQVGILYNEDDRAPRIAIPRFEALGLAVGNNQPYSGKALNATMNLHAEARGLPYLAIEVRNDLISDPAGVEGWAAILAPVIAETRDALS